jgi:hypothetical protein
MPKDGPCQDVNIMLHTAPWLEARNFRKPQGIMHDMSGATRTHTHKKKTMLYTCSHDLLIHET